jgi:hypothetical protein
MRITTQNALYPSLTDHERYRGTDAKFWPTGTVTLTMSNNTVLTPKIRNLLNEKNNNNIPILKFENGLLNISSGASYRVPTRYNGLQAYSFHADGYSNWKAAYDLPEQDFSSFVSQAEFEDIYTTNRFLMAFKSKTFDDFLTKITLYNPNTSPAAELKRLGAPTGEYIKISKYDEEFMIDNNDSIFTKEDIETLRDCYNRRDCREFNHPPGTIYKIEGKNYVVDENWRLTIPEGVICTPSRTEIIKPKINK